MIAVFAGRAVVAPALLLAILFAGCGGLPEYSLPRTYSAGMVLPDHVVSYRNLVVTDFQATNLPDFLHDHARQLNAHTAVAIRTAPGSEYFLSQTPEDLGTAMYSGRVENLVFEAVMIPAHSWWNPGLAREKTDYVLQHEQIHFGLMELAARRLTARAFTERDRLSIHDTSGEAVRKRLLERIDRWMAESEEEVLRQHTEFDRATSRRYAPEIQQQWYDRMERELKEGGGRD